VSDIAQRAAPEGDAAPYRWRWAAFAVVLAGSVSIATKGGGQPTTPAAESA
jgi:hypothetical protein